MDSRLKWSLGFAIVDAVITFRCIDGIADQKGIDIYDLVSPLRYSPFSSIFEIFVLWFGRLSLAHYAAFLVQYGKESNFMKSTGLRLSLIIACAILSGLKLVALAENSAVTDMLPLCVLHAWTAVAPILIHLYWKHAMAVMETKDMKEADIPLTFEQYLQIFKYSLQEWKWFAAYAVIMMVETSVGVNAPRYKASLISTIASKENYDGLYRIIITMAVLESSKYLLQRIQTACASRASRNMQLRIKTRLFANILHQDVAFFDTTKPGALLNTLGSDTSEFGRFVKTSLNGIKNLTQISRTLLYMLGLSWQLSIISLVPALVTYLLDYMRKLEYRAIEEKRVEDECDAAQIAHEAITTIHNVRAHGSERWEIRRYTEKLITEDGRKELMTFFRGVRSQLGEKAVESAHLMALVAYGMHLINKGTITSEIFVAFFMYQRETSDHYANLYYYLDSFTWFSKSSRKVLHYMTLDATVRNEGKLTPEVKGNLSIDNVTFAYPSRPEAPVLKDFTLDIRAGETVAIVGHSGAGKSSVVSLLEHFYEPQSGSICLDGAPIQGIDHEHYHQRVALVAQEPVLYGRSIRDNIAYGIEGVTEEEIVRASKMANAHGFINELPEKYDTLCGERGVRMSGGQKQRIAIARALVRNPAVLILDEATSALDAESEHAVQEAIEKCAIDRTVIIIAHRLSTIKNSDRIVVLSKGTITEQGSHFELMKIEDGIYRRLVRKQLRVQSTDRERRLTIEELEEEKSEESGEEVLVDIE